MRLATDDCVIETLATDRSDQPFGNAVLPGRGWCNRLVPDAHGAQSACDDGTIDAIPVADHVARSFDDVLKIVMRGTDNEDKIAA